MPWPSVRGKDHVHDRHDLRHHHRPADALQRTRPIRTLMSGASPHRTDARREQPTPDRNSRLRPSLSRSVRRAAGPPQRPAHRRPRSIRLRLAGAKIGADRGQRDVDDADIDQVHEIAHQQQHGCGPGVDAPWALADGASGNSVDGQRGTIRRRARFRTPNGPGVAPGPFVSLRQGIRTGRSGPCSPASAAPDARRCPRRCRSCRRAVRVGRFFIGIGIPVNSLILPSRASL